MAAVTIHRDFGAQENKICHCSHLFPICHEVMRLDAMILVFWMLSFMSVFSLFTVIKKLFSSFSLSAIRVVSSAYHPMISFNLVPALNILSANPVTQGTGALLFKVWDKQFNYMRYVRNTLRFSCLKTSITFPFIKNENKVGCKILGWFLFSLSTESL